jgi:hypothetical protein
VSGANPSGSTAGLGEQFLDWCREAVVDVFHDMEALHDRLEDG